MNCEYEGKFLNVNEAGFNAAAIDIFRFQYKNNLFYQKFCSILKVSPENVANIKEIPFLPIQFFKQQDIVTTEFSPELVFESSGTTGDIKSRHLVKKAAIYEKSFLEGFRMFYGREADWCIIGLLPSYLERQNSSLVYMVKELIHRSGNASGGFYLYDFEKLAAILKENEANGQKTLLVGVTFALLDFAKDYSFPLKHTVIMETGGMKGRGRELTREEVHGVLKKAFGVAAIHAEYGMTELLSQAYSEGNGIFKPVSWMKILLREEDNPLSLYPREKNGVQQGIINIIDLANIYSCSFIATDDIGRLHNDGRFEVLGRMDSADVRGCSLMVS